MRPAALIVLAAVTAALLASSTCTASTTSPPAHLTSSPTSTSSSSRLSVLFPAISAALRDLSVVDSDDLGYLTVAKRNICFMFSAMVSPLQLLDWSHWSPQLPSAEHRTRSSEDSYDDTAAMEQERYEEHEAPSKVEEVDEDADFALHGDPSHMLRVSVNAHNPRVVPATPHHYVSSSSSVTSTVEADDTNADLTTMSSSQPTESRMHTMQLASTAPPSTQPSSDVGHNGYNQMLDSTSSSYNPMFDDSSSSSYYPDPYSSTGVPPIIPIQPDSSSSGAPYVPLSSSSSSSSPTPPGSTGCNQFVNCGPGKAVNFTLYNSTLGQLCTRQLCVCPYDYTGSRCDLHYIYSCRPWLQADTHQQCMAVRNLPQATAYASHSERRPNTHISASSSDYFTYEGILSGPSPPCVSLDGSARELLFNFTCRFWEQYTTETWGDYGWWNRTVTDGWLQKGTLPTFAYYARNVDPDTNQTVFAISVPYDPLRVTIRVHNTVHPSQYNHTTLVLTAPNLQYTGTANGQVVPLSLPFDLRTLQYNFKRGGRVLLTLAFATSPWGLHSSSSGMPWQLTIEDGTWELPGPRAQVLLTRWQTAGVVLLVVVVLLLLVWRWYQRRQTAKMQALLAEQRGKQQSWFEHTQ